MTTVPSILDTVRARQSGSAITARRLAGIAKAKSSGKLKGRPANTAREAEICKAIAAGERVTHLAKRLGVARTTVYAALRKQEARNAQA